MVDVTNGGGYGRFYEPAESKTGATTASEKASKILTDIKTKGGAAVGAAAETLKKSIAGGLPGFDAIGLSVPGLDSFNSFTQSTQDLSLKTGYDQGQTKTPPPADFKPPLPNLLNQYVSVNAIFTLSILSDEAINFPDLTYKKGQLGPIILKSANGAPADKLIKTAFGSYNFYLDDLKMSTIMGLNQTTGVSNATSVSFKIIEPYSMGLFFQSIQIGAYQAGHANYTQAPLLLTIEWKGWTDLNKETPVVIKHIPIKVRELTMQVTGRGCEYNVEAYPWNEQAMSKTFNEVKTDIGIECDKGKYTIQNLLQSGANSLQAVLNRRLQETKKKEKVDAPDEILIIFPKDLTSNPSTNPSYSNESAEKSATSSPSTAGANAFYSQLGVSQGANSTKVQGSDADSINQIGQSPMGFNEQNKGESPFAKDADSYDKEKGIVKIGSLTIDLNNSKFHFTQGALITDIITNVILNSDYGRSALSKAQETPEGQVIWFRIESQVYNISQEDGKTGTKPKCIVYRVVPYKVDSSRFMEANSKKSGLEQTKKQVLKEYNYIYTGKNTEILSFNIDFQAGFYTALFAGANTEGDRLKENTGQSVDDKNRDATVGSSASGGMRNGAQVFRGGLAGGSTPPENPTQVRYDQTESKTAKLGGAGSYDDTATKVARQFHDVITNQADMINLELEILGDPYYIADSGMGNYSAKEVQGYDNITGDGSVNYQNGEVVVTVNFRTPIDIDLEKGSWDFRDSEPVAQFSGLFRVISVDNSITKNKFTQVLHLVRLPGQDTKLPEKSTETLANNESSGYTAQSQAQRSPAAQSINNSSSSYYGSTTNQTNNVNTSPPDPGLPGVVYSGGVTI
jgi:hypothetical protein